MPSPEQAVDSFVARLREVAACVSDRPVMRTGFRPSSSPYTVGFAPLADPVPIRSVDHARRLLLGMRLEYTVQAVTDSPRDYTVQIVGYTYYIAAVQGHELLAWHWHPMGSSAVTQTHLHLSSQVMPIELGRNLDRLPLADLHIPTGPVGLADVVRFLIAETGVQPRKQDWQAVLG